MFEKTWHDMITLSLAVEKGILLVNRYRIIKLLLKVF